MGKSATVTPRTTITTGTGTVASIMPAAGLSDYSLHDCTDPGQASVMNCIWPLGALPGTVVTFKNGLTVHSRNPQTLTVTVTTK